jgi:uncharacterized protein (DUF433 family)
MKPSAEARTMKAMSREAEKVIDDLVWQDAGRVSGAPCFYGTRVPLSILFDYIEGGDSLDEFLSGYPSVSRDQAIGVIRLSKRGIDQLLEAA